MNLIVRITILFVLVSLIVFLVGGFISYDVMMQEVEYEQRRFLQERLERMERVVEEREPTDTIQWNKLVVVPLRTLREERRVYSDTLVMHSQLGREESHLKLDVIKNVNGRSYFISVYDIIIEPDDIQEGLVESLITMYLILLGAVLIIGFAASYYILRPFNLTLAQIQKFSLKNPDHKINFPTSKVAEFKRLNAFLEDMTNKVRLDYQSLKEFTENASHEFQTPIAIVQSKLEVLLNDSELTEKQAEQIGLIQSAIRRLSNLSNSLALITKIDNNEFINVSDVNVSNVLNGMLDEFNELFQLKKIEKIIEIEEDIHLQADQVLIELLLTNLINNSIRHNWEEGTVNIHLRNRHLIISNTGPELSIEPEDLFRRFKKSNQSAQSLGLGLAIVKRICEFYHFDISYRYQNGYHTIQIDF